ncbi:flavodoxin family protein [Actinophytocola gossypii]|uniref:Flavodoxin family protein n=1 Tax=Actinophytocola gossypii TaxID=2812003 RepID=A0ABT2J1A7_9PSEU|nr:NAD(P)H-dependent oxidoreductase [Actinophytocola gossypii]MCT2581645.1 flavodoxin family protein [Actinophytocola gossypii]
MRALILNCSLKKSPERSNTQLLADIVATELRNHDVTVDTVRIVDHTIAPGVQTDLGDPTDYWPTIHGQLLESEILIIATPTWLGRPSSVAQRVLERMDAMLSETGDDDRPVAYDRVAGVVVTGNEDGAHHVISEVSGALVDVGYTIPGQAWVYWNMGPGPGPNYTDTDHGHDWAEQTAGLMGRNLHRVASALNRGPRRAGD